jgi:hypothetical protein
MAGVLQPPRRDAVQDLQALARRLAQQRRDEHDPTRRKVLAVRLAQVKEALLLAWKRREGR